MPKLSPASPASLSVSLLLHSTTQIRRVCTSSPGLCSSNRKKKQGIRLYCDLTDVPGCALMCPAAVNITRNSNYRNAPTDVPKADSSVGRVNKNYGVSLRSTQMEMLSCPACSRSLFFHKSFVFMSFSMYSKYFHFDLTFLCCRIFFF